MGPWVIFGGELVAPSEGLYGRYWRPLLTSVGCQRQWDKEIAERSGGRLRCGRQIDSTRVRIVTPGISISWLINSTLDLISSQRPSPWWPQQGFNDDPRN